MRVREPGWAAWLIRVLLVPLLLIVAATGMAQAHAVVTGTQPTDGAVLPSPPSEVVVQFNEPVSLTRAQVLGPDGEEVLPPDGGRNGQDGLHLPLPEGLAQGTYTVSYHVVSLDGHPVAGSLVFSVGAVSGVASGMQEAGQAQVGRWAFVAARVALYFGLFGAAGGVAYRLLVRPGEAGQGTARRLSAASAILGMVAAAATLGLQGGLLLGGYLDLLADPETWRIGATSTFGRTALCDIVGLAIIWAGSRARASTGADLVVGAGALVVLVGFALSGHVVTAGSRWLTSPPLLLHAAAAAFWVGSLVPLHRALTGPLEEAGRLFQRFSSIATWAVAGLVAAGSVVAWLQVRQPEALLTTGYGRVLLIKLALVACLLSLAALNRLYLTPALVRGDPRAPRRFGWSIVGEVGLVIAILTATATLGTTPPPRALTSRAPIDTHDVHAHQEHGHGHLHGGQSLSLAGQGFEAVVQLQPGQIGPNMTTISLQDLAGQPFDVLEVTLNLSNPGRGIAPLKRPAQRESVGSWRVPELVLAVEGEWEIELDVLVSDFERQTLKGSLELD